MAGGGFLGEWFLDEVAGGGLFLEGLLAGFGGFQFFFELIQMQKRSSDEFSIKIKSEYPI